MSSFLAIATVTAALRNLLKSNADYDVQDHSIDYATLPPAKAADSVEDARINIYLYQITPNAAWRNADLPTRRSDGSLMQRPQVALDLHYIISFYGDESRLVPQRLLGSVVRTLHALPQLDWKQMRETLNDQLLNFPKGSNLGDQPELVRFSPLHLSLEELSKIWSVFFQVPYALSVAYQGSVVLIEGTEAVQEAKPVVDRNAYSSPSGPPFIESIAPQVSAYAPGARLTLRGRNLGGNTSVRFGTVAPLQPPSARATDTQLVVTLPDGIRAGMNTVQVIRRLPMGLPEVQTGVPALHTIAESNAVVFMLGPRLDALTFDKNTGLISVTVTPAVGVDQQAALMLNQFADPPPPSPLVFNLVAQQRTSDSTTLSFDAHEVPPGTYLARVRVDGADSLLTIEKNNYTGPLVVIA